MIGIYIIKNTINNKFYLGSSNNIENRWKQHKRLLEINKHHSPHLQFAYNKYGNIFTFEILEYCSEVELKNKEQFYLDNLKPWNQSIGYNIDKFTRSCKKENRKKIYKNLLLVDQFKNIIKSYNYLKDVAYNEKVTLERCRQILNNGKFNKKLGGYLIEEKELDKIVLYEKKLTLKEKRIQNKRRKIPIKIKEEKNKINELKRIKLLYNQMVSRKNKNKFGEW